MMSFVIHTLWRERERERVKEREREREYLLNDSNMALYYTLLKILKQNFNGKHDFIFFNCWKVNVSVSHCRITNQPKHSAD